MRGNFKYASWVKIFYLFIVLISFIGCRKLKYPTGRDTVKAFGNGRFQIFDSGVLLDISQGGGGIAKIIDKNGKLVKRVVTGGFILSRVVDYKEKNNKVFVTGFYPPARKVVYVLLDLTREKYYIYKNLKDIPEMYKEIFKSLKIE